MCEIELSPGWHSDHVVPYSRGGLTDVVNGQALCPSCNLRKGAEHTMTRNWQETALQRFITSTTQNFLVTATPASGKTRFALAAAGELIENGSIGRIIVVVPTSHLRGQWEKAAHAHFGIQLNSKFENGDGALARDMHGVVITYAAVASSPATYRMLAAGRRTLVILDEVHHAGEERKWGTALRTAFEPAVRRLSLSGTPFRSDGNDIPFVRYEVGEDGVRRSKSDFAYTYGQALNDGVVRNIAFNALDGQAKWRSAGVVVEGSLSSNDEKQAKRALRTVLEPDGDWIKSVLLTANTELSRVREEVPDAGGLVVAPDQRKAEQYAALLTATIGEPALLAVSDVPDASSVIAQFAAGTSRWLVAVNMVSEGVDIPRLAVGVFASTYATEMFFRQVAGRFVRTRGPDDELCASLYLPSIPVLLSYAATIEEERDTALEKAIKHGEVLRGESVMLDVTMVEPLTSSEATHHSTILGGESFTDTELTRASGFAQEAGLPGNVGPAQVARLLRLAGIGGSPVRVNVPTPNAGPSLAKEKEALRKLFNGKVALYCRETNVPFGYVHGDLNKQFGDKVATATVETLMKRLEQIDRWIEGLR